jgi:hypothetical protein
MRRRTVRGTVHVLHIIHELYAVMTHRQLVGGLYILFLYFTLYLVHLVKFENTVEVKKILNIKFIIWGNSFIYGFKSFYNYTTI